MDVSEKRKAARFDLQVGAGVAFKKNGRTFRATTVNASGSGVLLEFEDSPELGAGDSVYCDFGPVDGHMLPSWVTGNVVRVEGRKVALEFTSSGHFEPIAVENKGGAGQKG
jgi:PilZ domain